MGSFVSRMNGLQNEINNVSKNTRWNVFIICTVLLWIIGFILMYSYIKFDKLCSLDIIKKRYPVIVKMECCLSMFTAFISVPIMICNSSNLPILEPYTYTVRILYAAFVPLFSHGIVNLESCRCWLMYFKMNNLFSHENKEWKNIINGNKDDDNNFWLKYKNTYGNVKDFVYIVLYILYIPNALTKIGSMGLETVFYILYYSNIYTDYNYYDMGCEFYQPNSGKYLYLRYYWININILHLYHKLKDALCYSPPIVLIVLLYFKCPKIIDKYLFYFEFSATAWFFLSGLVLYAFDIGLWYVCTFMETKYTVNH